MIKSKKEDLKEEKVEVETEEVVEETAEESAAEEAVEETAEAPVSPYEDFFKCPVGNKLVAEIVESIKENKGGLKANEEFKILNGKLQIEATESNQTYFLDEGSKLRNGRP